MKHRVSIPPVAEPISLVEAKLHLRVDHTTDDELIKTLITASSQWCEAYEGRAYMVRTSQLKLDSFGRIYLPFPPVQSVSSITYVDTEGTTQTLSSAVYTLYNSGDYAYIDLAYNQSWPTTQALIDEPITVTYVHGFSTTFTAADTDIMTVGNMIFAESDIIRVETDQGDLPSPLAVGTNYYVRVVSGSTFKPATADADVSVVNIADAGTGTHYVALAETGLVPASAKAAMKILLSHLYEQRQMVVEGNIGQEIPFGIKNLLFERCW
jgi:uncharacterized phiE125 gp8 family phage protein